MGAGRAAGSRKEVVVEVRCVKKIENFGMGSPYNLFFLGGTFRNVQFGTIRKVHYRNQNNHRLAECLFAKYMIGPPFAECSLNVNEHITFNFLNTFLR